MKSVFAKKLITLLTGTGLAQIISLLFVYLLTFFYSPIDYKNYSIFVGIVTILGGIITLKYELAIPLVKKNEDAVSLVHLSILITTTLSIIIFITSYSISLLFLSDYLYYILIGAATIFFVGLYNILLHWALREEAFTEIAVSRVSQATIGGLAHTLLGFLGYTKYGLPIGNFFNFNAGFFRLLKVFRKQDIKPNWKLSKSNFYIFKKYPLFSTLESLFLNASQHAPIILMGIFYGAQAGIFMLCTRIMAAPVGLIGENLKSLYLSEIGKIENNNTEVKALTENIINKTVLFGSIPILLISIFGYFFADIFFPSSWKGIGAFMLIIAPWMNLSVVSKSFSVYYNYTNKQEINFYFNAILFLSGVVTLVVGHHYNLSRSIEYFCIVNFLIYFVYYVISSIRLGIFIKKIYFITLIQVALMISYLIFSPL